MISKASRLPVWPLLLVFLTGCSFEFNRTFDVDASFPSDTGLVASDTGTVALGTTDETASPDTHTDTATGDTGEAVTDTGTATHEAATATEDTEVPTENTEIPTENTEVPTENTETASAATDTGVENAITSGTLAHRWRFNGDLTDEVGASDAEIGVPDNPTGLEATLSSSEVTLAGGPATEAEYISLGSHLLTSIDGPLTIELFATFLAVNFFPRIFECGADIHEYVAMTWAANENGDSDAVIWWGGGEALEDMLSVWDTNAPYTLEEEHHIVMTIDPDGGDGGAMRIAWYTALASSDDIGEEKGAIETNETLSDLDDPHCWLGKSHSDADPVSIASYNDVRIWSGALTQEDIEILHDLGPDM